MMKLKRQFLMMLTVTLILGIALTGCGSTAPTTASSAPAASSAAASATSETASESAVSEKTAELKWYFPGGWPQTEQDRIFAEVNTMLKEKINVTCEFVPSSYGDYDNKISVVIASAQDYDVCFTSNWINNYVKNVSKGAFLPLDELLVNYAPKTLAAVPSSFWDATKVKGKIYAVVNQQISARTPNISIPEELAKKYAFDPATYVPGDLSTLNPFIEKVFAENPDLYADCNAIFAEYLGMDALAGVNIPGAILVNDPSMTVINQFTSEPFLKNVAVIREWNQKGWTLSTKRISAGSDVKTPGVNQTILTVGGAYKPGGAVFDSKGLGYNVIQLPAAKPILSTSAIIATMQAVSTNSKNPEAAMKMLELFNNDPDAFMLLNYGIKGEHWDVDGSGQLIDGPQIANYNPNVPWMFATNYMQIPQAGQPADVWEQTKKMNDEGLKSPTLGFSFDGEPVKGEIAKCSAIYDEYARGIQLGVYSEADITEMVSKMNAAGSDLIIAEMQKQVNEWKAAK